FQGDSVSTHISNACAELIGLARSSTKARKAQTKTCSIEFLVPTLCVGMPSSTLRVVFRPRAAERPGRHSHAERGNEDESSPDGPRETLRGPDSRPLRQTQRPRRAAFRSAGAFGCRTFRAGGGSEREVERLGDQPPEPPSQGAVAAVDLGE